MGKKLKEYKDKKDLIHAFEKARDHLLGMKPEDKESNLATYTAFNIAARLYGGLLDLAIEELNLVGGLTPMLRKQFKLLIEERPNKGRMPWDEMRKPMRKYHHAFVKELNDIVKHRL